MLRSQWVLVLALGVFSSNPIVSISLAHDDHKLDAVKVEKNISDRMAKLTPEDRKLAEAQRFCPMMAYGRLGAMGAPIKLEIEGKPVFVCCKDCVDGAVKGGKEMLAKASKLTKASAVLAKLSPEDRVAAESQKYCAVADGSFLGGMGAPIKLVLNGKPVFLCCSGCTEKAKANAIDTIAKTEKLIKAGVDEAHPADHNHAPAKK